MAELLRHVAEPHLHETGQPAAELPRSEDIPSSGLAAS
jgi:hypothetical protein